MADVFISYAREDRVRCDELLAALGPAVNEGAIRLHFDGSLTAGEAYFNKLMKMIETADIALYLVSAASLASSAVAVEMQFAQTRLKAGPSARGFRIVPIILEHCRWKESLLGIYECLPEGAIPLADAGDKGEAWRKIAIEISSLATLFDRPQRHERWELLPDERIYALREEVKKALAAMQETVVGPFPSMETAIQLKRQEETLKSLTNELRARLGSF